MAEPHNINLDIWKELFIFANCSNLVLNLICPSFPFINNWFFIENIHAGLFDNVAQYDRFNNSEVARKISKELKAIDKLNYHPFADPRNKRPLNVEFLGLSGRISGALAYSESNIVMSGAAIAITMEYVGRTLKDVPLLALNPLNEKVVWLQKFLSDVDSFSKYMFDYIYGFYCMNVKLGILHGDLHLNNATIYYKALGSYTDLPGDPHIAYVLSDDEAYLFPHMGTYGCLIDFSRSIIGDKTLLLTEYTEDYAGQYLENQREQLWAFLVKYFPKFTENNKDRILGRLQDNYFAMFKVATGVDSYSVAQNLLTFVAEVKNLTIAPEIKKFIIRARDVAESIIIRGLEKLIEDPLAREDGLEWPNLELIRALFGRFRAPKEIKDKRIVNIYNFKNDIRYKIQSYELWPPLLKLESEIELAKSRSDGAKVAERLEKNIEAIRSDEADEVRKVVSEFVRSLAQ
jgi:hypothetical protein